MSLLDQVSAERIAADTLELVGIASPTTVVTRTFIWPLCTRRFLVYGRSILSKDAPE